MALWDIGSSLSAVDDAINNFIGSHFQPYQDWVDQQRAEKAQQAPREGFSGALANTAEMGGQVGTAITAGADKVPGARFVLDFGNRSLDTITAVGRQADIAGHNDPGWGGAGWAELFNKDTWAKAWDSWGQPGHVSAGAIESTTYFSNDDRVRFASPFDAQEAQLIQQGAHDSWYGETFAGAVDLAGGFINPIPGASFVRDAKAAKAVNLATAEKMANVYSAARAADTVGDLKATKVADTAKTRLGGTASTESLVSQMVTAVKKTDDIPDQVGMMNYLGPWMQNSTEAAKATMADLFVQANKLDDPLAREHVKMNAVLGMMGSPLAKSELRAMAPTVLRSMENVTTAPQAIALSDDLINARVVGGEYSTNAILRQHFENSGAKAEQDALRKEIADHISRADHLDELASIRTGSGQETLFGGNAEVAQAAAARSQAAGAQAKLDQLIAEQKHTASGVEAANRRIAQMWSIGEDESHIMTGKVAPSRLDQVKTAFRDAVGDQYLYRTSDALPNVFLQAIPRGAATLSAIGTPRARGGINLAEPRVGQLELMESLRRSKVFSADEVRAAGNRFIATPADKRGSLIENYQDMVLGRVAAKHGRTAEEALRDAGLAKRAYNDGRQYLADGIAEAEGQGANIVMLRGLDGELNAYNLPMLKSHIQDTAPFMDPTMFDHALTKLDDGIKARGLTAAYYADEANVAFQNIWRHAVLMRPGLATRAMLDTGLRSTALIGAGTQLAQSVNAMRKLTMKGASKTPGLSRIGLRRPLDQLAGEAMGLKQLKVDLGGGESGLLGAYDDVADMTAKRMALTKGSSVHGALLGQTRREFNRLQIDRDHWRMYEPDHRFWPQAYAEQAGVMLNSPTVRAMLDQQKAGVGAAVDLETYVRDLFKNPDVNAEYNLLARPQGLSKVDFTQTVLHETSLMFPNADMAAELTAGALKGGGRNAVDWAERHFPTSERFSIPGPESVFAKEGIKTKLRNATDAFYRTMLDAPDFWMARHPVYVTKWRRTVQDEAQSLLDYKRSLDPDATISKAELRTIDQRAKTAATTTVRNTMFDTARYTGAHHYVSKISPFFGAWEDAMMSWSRLLYDNPKRMGMMAGAWNAPQNMSQWLPDPIFVDGNGKPLARGEESSNGKYIVLPVAGKIKGVQDVRISQDALNSIAQGGIAWLPGFGPTAQVATTTLLTDVLPRDIALDVIGTDNWMGQNLLQSMYYQGEVPQGDLGSIAGSLMPSSVRNLYRDTFGDNYAANVSYLVNNAYIEAQRNGVPFDQNAAVEEAKQQARAAGIVRLIQQGVIGLSGRAAVEGQFYVDQMHQIRALSRDQLKAAGFGSAEEMFAKMFPDAAKLDWNLTRNETGINATVSAEKSASRQRGLVDQYPEMGWFIVGSENISSADNPFSQSAYNMQKSETYGLSGKGRVREDGDETVRGAVVSQGWGKYTKYMLQIQQLDAQYSLTDGEQAALKRAVVKYIADGNREWLVDYNTREDKLSQFYSDADAIAAKPGMKDRPDIQAYLDYRSARDEAMKAAGVSSLSGTGRGSALARAYLRQIGGNLAQENLGFQQMWDRMLSNEVEAKATDAAKLEVAA